MIFSSIALTSNYLVVRLYSESRKVTRALPGLIAIAFTVPPGEATDTFAALGWQLSLSR
jgi:hypothetical protein